MKIDKKKLIDLLVEKTELDRDEVKKQLDQLIERILDAAKRGKALEIKEFGTFYFDEEGELRFDVSKELSTEISFKYAGMKPVELKPERDTSISALDEEEEDGEDEKEQEPAPFDVDEPQAASVTETEESDTSEDETDDDLFGDPFDSPSPDPFEEPVQEEKKINDANQKPAIKRSARKRKDPIGMFILLGIIVVAALIGGYFYYVGMQTQQNTSDEREAEVILQPESGTEETEGADEMSATQPETDNAGSLGAGQQTDVNGQGTAEPEESNPVSSGAGTEVSLEDSDQSLYGLRGTVTEEVNNGYSIVLHSFLTEERAMSAANQLREDGYRIIITTRTVSGDTVWRVSVGQFQTLADAQQATTLLPSPYDTQNFIQRLRNN